MVQGQTQLQTPILIYIKINGTMSTEEELNEQIADLAEQIKKAKEEKKPKEEWDPILKDMLALKVIPSLGSLPFVDHNN